VVATCWELLAIAAAGPLLFLTAHKPAKSSQGNAQKTLFTDPLTGLATLELLNDRLAMALHQARRASRRVGMIVLNLDGMTALNQSFSPSRGDAILQHVAQRCRNAVRESDTVARLSGDTYAIVLSALGRDFDVERVARKLLKDLAKPYRIDNKRIFLTATAGICVFPDDGSTAEQLMSLANNALREGKRAGKNCYVRTGKPAADHAAPELSLG